MSSVFATESVSRDLSNERALKYKTDYVKRAFSKT
jgi:hypothetical protein